MDFTNARVMNFDGAFRGMRNPLESWEKSDSLFGIISEYSDYESICEDYTKNWLKDKIKGSMDFWEVKKYILENGKLRTSSTNIEAAFLGVNDISLAQKLIKAGPEHRKFMRQIFVSVDITAPLFWFKEFDTYRIGVTANSTSTMHKITSKPITINSFEIDDYEADAARLDDCLMNPQAIIGYCESLRLKFLETKDLRYWKELIRWLPESWLQTRTITFTYENLYSIVHQRKNHKLSEWKQFINWVRTLPYANELIFYEEDVV